MRTEDVLLVIDVQNDFMSGGALAVADGDAVVPVINRLARRFEQVVITQDWHPRAHVSFAANHPGREPFSTITLPYGEQVLWPVHCVQDSEGAALHRELDIPEARLVIRKGLDASVDSYSAFVEADRSTPTGLAGYLASLGAKRVWCCGLATDYCLVRARCVRGRFRGRRDRGRLPRDRPERLAGAGMARTSGRGRSPRPGAGAARLSGPPSSTTVYKQFEPGDWHERSRNRIHRPHRAGEIMARRAQHNARRDVGRACGGRRGRARQARSGARRCRA